MSGHAWFAGLTVDHLYADCPNRVSAKTALLRAGYWNLGGGGADPHGSDICGMCVHRHGRAQHATGVTP
jgi:hypothetical protein